MKLRNYCKTPTNTFIFCATLPLLSPAIHLNRVHLRQCISFFFFSCPPFLGLTVNDKELFLFFALHNIHMFNQVVLSLQEHLSGFNIVNVMLLMMRCEFFYIWKVGTENPFQLTFPIQKSSHVLQHFSEQIWCYSYIVCYHGTFVIFWT